MQQNRGHNWKGEPTHYFAGLVDRIHGYLDFQCPCSDRRFTNTKMK